ncbi:MAG: hypothetical protein N2044_09680 [Cyclobacteriaceae bacterium]|nr:hypothetical protein [Cyclobacteriaceae bacterium]MCX7638099.1 hypothetical protein [Cyclobacteriaceae bacterium]MDW8331599.1 RHS repeat-associated core domain-containing protein [Cyclobacteriaceae bacterium]
MNFNPVFTIFSHAFRSYDPALGRMNQIDPMAAKYASLTPYNYSFNDPVSFNDPSGADTGDASPCNIECYLSVPPSL